MQRDQSHEKRKSLGSGNHVVIYVDLVRFGDDCGGCGSMVDYSCCGVLSVRFPMALVQMVEWVSSFLGELRTSIIHSLQISRHSLTLH